MRKYHPHLLYLSICYQEWENAANRGQYCYQKFLSQSTLLMVQKMKKQFAELLHELKFVSTPSAADISANKNSGIGKKSNKEGKIDRGMEGGDREGG